MRDISLFNDQGFDLGWGSIMEGKLPLRWLALEIFY